MTPTVLIHIDADGEASYHLNGDVQLIIVDERAPHDRVYEYTTQTSAEEIIGIIGDDNIGSQFDARHAAASARIECAATGKPVLTIVGESGE